MVAWVPRLVAMSYFHLALSSPSCSSADAVNPTNVQDGRAWRQLDAVIQVKPKLASNNKANDDSAMQASGSNSGVADPSGDDG